ncbi:MAG: TonB family protein [Bryobacterales bacterium]|nr:TonB family protein [Bryobacterales bacterium]
MKQSTLLVLALTVAGHGQGLPDADTTVTYQPDEGVRPPVVLSQTSPRYPEDALKAKFQAIVKLSISIGSDGTTEDVKVVHGAGLGLEENAVQAVRRWRFTPGTKDGQPVPVTALVEVHFRLRYWRTLRLTYQTAPDASAPVPTLRFLPANGKSCDPATLALQIGPDGRVSDVRTVLTTPDSINQRLIESVRAWRFQPSRRNGVPVESHAEAEFDCEPWPAPK